VILYSRWKESCDLGRYPTPAIRKWGLGLRILFCLGIMINENLSIFMNICPTK